MGSIHKTNISSIHRSIISSTRFKFIKRIYDQKGSVHKAHISSKGFNSQDRKNYRRGFNSQDKYIIKGIQFIQQLHSRQCTKDHFSTLNAYLKKKINKNTIKKVQFIPQFTYTAVLFTQSLGMDQCTTSHWNTSFETCVRVGITPTVIILPIFISE